MALILGPALFVIAVIGLILAAPPNGEIKLANRPLLQNVVALAITITGAVGIVVTFLGLAAAT
jgi:hypothetical protein